MTQAMAEPESESFPFEEELKSRPPENPKDLKSYVFSNLEKLRKYRTAFINTFKIEIKYFWDNITGFDVRLQTPDGVSTKDFINEKYGKEAVKIIEQLI